MYEEEILRHIGTRGTSVNTIIDKILGKEKQIIRKEIQRMIMADILTYDKDWYLVKNEH